MVEITQIEHMEVELDAPDAATVWRDTWEALQAYDDGDKYVLDDVIPLYNGSYIARFHIVHRFTVQTDDPIAAMQTWQSKREQYPEAELEAYVSLGADNATN